MNFDDMPAPEALINLKSYAAQLRISRQAVHYQLVRGICAVPPLPGMKPPKWRLSDVERYVAATAAMASADQ